MTLQPSQALVLSQNPTYHPEFGSCRQHRFLHQKFAHDAQTLRNRATVILPRRSV